MKSCFPGYSFGEMDAEIKHKLTNPPTPPPAMFLCNVGTPVHIKVNNWGFNRHFIEALKSMLFNLVTVVYVGAGSIRYQTL